jgi:hypothetical protein
MIDAEQDESKRLRLAVYTLLIATCLAITAGRIGAVAARDGRTPFLSANDRSRWCTVRSLVEYGSYEIDSVIGDRGWNTIDKVQHLGKDGEPHFYSSKPPLLATLVAGPYWIVHRITGTTLREHPFYVGRALLWMVQLPLLAFYLICVVQLVERWGETDWGRIFVATVVCFGTFLTTMAVTLNNHLPAALAVAVALCGLVRITSVHKESIWAFPVIGFFSALAAANDLPALSFFAVSLLMCAIKSWRWTLLLFSPAALLVVAGFFGTNWLAHADWRPPYAHRSDGDNWYDYENSYWHEENRKGVDRGEPSRRIYALHATVGHHGVLSLTPVWLLSAVGVFVLLGSPGRKQVGWLILVLSCVCMMFYLTRSVGDRNYGGVCCGFRWMFWLAPLWLAAMIPVADWISERRFARYVAILLFVISSASAAYGWSNPWTHPWPYAYGLFMQWW